MDYLIKRQQKVYQNMKVLGMHKALIGEPMSIYYLTGRHVNPFERFYGLILDAEAGTIGMVTPSVDRGCMKGTVREYVYEDSQGPVTALKDALGICDVLGVDMNYFSMHIGKMLAQLETEIVALGDIITRIRLKKDEQEIKAMRRAAEIVDEAVAYVKPQIKPGMTEKELNLLLYSYMAKVPGFITEEVIILVQGGVNTAQPHGVSGDYIFQKGDIILLDFCAYYEYYWSDMTRCLFLGEPREKRITEIYNVVKEANLTAIKTVRPGVMAKEVDQAARKYIEDKGYGEYFIHRTGHGLGLSVHEEPYITSVNELILEEGMTFTIEPGVYIEGIGGVRIEDDILVTKDGCEVLTGTSKELQEHILEI